MEVKVTQQTKVAEEWNLGSYKLIRTTEVVNGVKEVRWDILDNQAYCLSNNIWRIRDDWMRHIAKKVLEV